MKAVKCTARRSPLARQSPGFISWNEAVNHVMGAPARMPSREVGERLKQTETRRRDWDKYRKSPKVQAAIVQAQTRCVEGLKETSNKNDIDELLSAPMSDWPVDSLDKFLWRLTRFRLVQTPELGEWCQRVAMEWRQWCDYDRRYLLAQAALLEAARNDSIAVFASRTSQKGATARKLLLDDLAADISIDVDRRHLRPNRYGETYVRPDHGPGDGTTHFNAKITMSTLRARLKALRSRFQGAHRAAPPIPRLSITDDVVAWFKQYVRHFLVLGVRPLEEQLVQALLIEWPENTKHRDAARTLVRKYDPKPLGAPTKRMRATK